MMSFCSLHAADPGHSPDGTRSRGLEPCHPPMYLSNPPPSVPSVDPTNESSVQFSPNQPRNPICINMHLSVSHLCCSVTLDMLPELIQLQKELSLSADLFPIELSHRLQLVMSLLCDNKIAPSVEETAELTVQSGVMGIEEGRKRERLRKQPLRSHRGMERSAKRNALFAPSIYSRRIESRTGHLWVWVLENNGKPMQLQTRKINMSRTVIYRHEGPERRLNIFHLLYCDIYYKSKLNPMPVTRRDKGHSECRRPIQ